VVASFAGMGVPEIRLLQRLEGENVKVNRLVANRRSIAPYDRM
jgi:hypothetical protein